jgi:predicted GNAT family acetyltransferase
MHTVRDNRAASRFEIDVDGQIAFLDYERKDNELAILHTEVPEPLRHQGLGTLLAKTAVATARAEGMRLKVLCKFVQAYRRSHPEPN